MVRVHTNQGNRLKAMVRVCTNHFILVCEDTNQGNRLKAMVRICTNHFILVCADTNQDKEFLLRHKPKILKIKNHHVRGDFLELLAGNYIEL